MVWRLARSFNKFVGLCLVSMMSGLCLDLGLEALASDKLPSIHRYCTVMCGIQNARLKNLNERERRQNDLSNAR